MCTHASARQVPGSQRAAGDGAPGRARGQKAGGTGGRRLVAGAAHRIALGLLADGVPQLLLGGVVRHGLPPLGGAGGAGQVGDCRGAVQKGGGGGSARRPPAAAPKAGDVVTANCCRLQPQPGRRPPPPSIGCRSTSWHCRQAVAGAAPQPGGDEAAPAARASLWCRQLRQHGHDAGQGPTHLAPGGRTGWPPAAATPGMPYRLALPAGRA
jgi:hypothetical protein